MPIPITISSPSSSNHKLPPGLVNISHDEILLIELQGSLEVHASDPSERNGQLVGELKLDTAGKPSLLIGHHLLEGKIAPLPKPYAVLVRSGTAPKPAYHSNEEDEEAIPVDSDSSASVTNAAWTIAGIVKKKIIFSQRPMPVIGRKT